jgi:hypothetical protein
MFIFLEVFNDPFVATVESTFQSSPGTRAKLHKVEAAEEGFVGVLDRQPTTGSTRSR